MNIQLEQVLTQALAFLILFWILKRFAWKPLLGIIEERKEAIASDFEQIRQEKEAVQRTAAEYEEKLKEIEEEARRQMSEAMQKGKERATVIQQEAHQEAASVLARAKEEIEKEVEKGKEQLKLDLVHMAIAITEKMLHQELDEEKQKKLISEFVERAEL